MILQIKIKFYKAVQQTKKGNSIYFVLSGRHTVRGDDTAAVKHYRGRRQIRTFCRVSAVTEFELAVILK